ncbi:ubiquitin-like protein [Dothidotthia symphoricarpi CBS 119687]|uniref:Ubiquitin-like protein n=1 Tax=Dothidotthia symphoricarpi CBS 119687 TaxID=1392245 RepID=A0A6A6AMK2_9PLEO|nr:ubiquitin-like protein [Dothidotthia symphoricarpi CBS 119687]KAF2131711.1 ubiquitin-like protein [Dothidotthia symphoricarpi CBS 119687]
MATHTTDQPSTAAQSTPQQAASGSRPQSSHEALSSSPVEMRTLQSSAAAPAPMNPTLQSSGTLEPVPAESYVPHVDELNAAGSTQHATTSAKVAPPAELTRAETQAIGPSTDTPAANPDNSNGPVLVIMLLLTTGARHPYKIDERYLKKRNVIVDDMDPYNISVYTLKELIWRDWREEWEPRPTSPSSIRLIHFGRMLDDKSPLKDCRFQVDTPNVVHMTVKPQEVVDDEDAKGGKSTSRRENEEEPTAGCRCVIL